MESILKTIRKLVGGLALDATPFDEDLIVFINSTFSILTQLGVGPKEGFFIYDDSATWSDFLGDDERIAKLVENYMYFKVKLAFDSASLSSSVLSYMQEATREYEWRLNVMCDKGD